VPSLIERGTRALSVNMVCINPVVCALASSDHDVLGVAKGIDVNVRRTASEQIRDQLHVKEDQIAVLSRPNLPLK